MFVLRILNDIIMDVAFTVEINLFYLILFGILISNLRHNIDIVFVESSYLWCLCFRKQLERWPSHILSEHVLQIKVYTSETFFTCIAG